MNKTKHYVFIYFTIISSLLLNNSCNLNKSPKTDYVEKTATVDSSFLRKNEDICFTFVPSIINIDSYCLDCGSHRLQYTHKVSEDGSLNMKEETHVFDISEGLCDSIKSLLLNTYLVKINKKGSSFREKGCHISITFRDNTKIFNINYGQLESCKQLAEIDTFSYKAVLLIYKSHPSLFSFYEIE